MNALASGGTNTAVGDGLTGGRRRVGGWPIFAGMGPTLARFRSPAGGQAAAVDAGEMPPELPTFQHVDWCVGWHDSRKPFPADQLAECHLGCGCPPAEHLMVACEVEARRRWKVAWAAWRVQHAPELLTNVDRAYLRQAGAGPGPVA